MRPFIRTALDLAFALAWLGLAVVMVAIAARAVFVLFGPHGSAKSLAVALEVFVIPLLALWVMLTVAVAVCCWLGVGAQQTEAPLWRRVFLNHPLVFGPTVFYVGSLRPKLLGTPLAPPAQWPRSMRAGARALDVLAFNGTLALFAIGVALLAVPSSLPDVLTVMMLGLVILIPVSGLSAMVLMVLLLLDSIRRATDADQGEQFLRMLNGWSGIFGVHRYFRRVLLPDMTRGATD